MKNILIYSKDQCSYCTAAKSLLESRNIEYEEANVQRSPERFAEMLRRSTQRTFPQIFSGEEHIGGYTELVKYLSSNAA